MVVLGGGLAGCEAAIHLAQEGKRFISWRCAPSLRRMPTFVTVRS
ncbi:MAG: FAD-dependent oxidoreductase [Lachnospiraceae bacterium]